MLNPFDDPRAELFTYKVKHDGGTAPNPFGGICTLAICKPAIRRVAKSGDVIVGFGCKSNGDSEYRIIYCMIVKETIPWPQYIAEANTGRFRSNGRVPRSENDFGDCIWKHTNGKHEPHASSSYHGLDDYERDVSDGVNVLVSTDFWYFGRGGMSETHGSLDILIDENTLPIVNRGHRSSSNYPRRHDFWQEFKSRIDERGLIAPGQYGTPAIIPESTTRETCSRCASAQREDDEFDEEIVE